MLSSTSRCSPPLRLVGLALVVLLSVPFVWVSLPPTHLQHHGQAPTSSPSSAAAFTDSEREHTLRFLRSFTDTIPDLQATWTGDNYCSWTEVHCRGSGVRVDLSGLRLRATNATLPDLAADIDGDQVGVTRLYLYHQGAQLQGTLPSSWARLRRLQSVMLLDNALTGTLPDAWGSMATMTALESVFLSLNNFTGTLPASWSALRSLRTVNAAANELTGSLPSSWSSLLALSLVDVSKNALCGCVPREWKSKVTLRLVTDAAVSADNCSDANACTSSSLEPGVH